MHEYIFRCPKTVFAHGSYREVTKIVISLWACDLMHKLFDFSGRGEGATSVHATIDCNSCICARVVVVSSLQSSLSHQYGVLHFPADPELEGLSH